jgi:hypothetical protein
MSLAGFLSGIKCHRYFSDKPNEKCLAEYCFGYKPVSLLFEVPFEHLEQRNHFYHYKPIGYLSNRL